MLNVKEMPWDKIVGEWDKMLGPVLTSKGMQNLMDFVVSESALSLVYPKQQDIFRAFRLCPPSRLKVIILGQDPYHDGSATGLAFANSRTTIRMSPSLKSIWEQCEKATETISIDFDLTLEEWAHQGVLLLNTALTVKKHDPTSHSKHWHPFTEAVLKTINESFTGLHICLWGSHARKFGEVFSDKRHYKYFAAHPIAHVYSGGTEWQCDHFTKINENIIKQNGEDEIITW